MHYLEFTCNLKDTHVYINMLFSIVELFVLYNEVETFFI